MSGASGSRERAITYPVRDAEGRLVAYHVREDTPEGKQVRWRRPDGGWGLNGTPLADLPLYGAELVSDLGEDELIVLTEGEKARDALEAANIPTVGTVTGASGTPGPDALEVLRRDRRVVLCADNDSAGHTHMQRVAETLHGVAAEVLVYIWDEAPEKGDAADHPTVQSRNPKAVDRLLTDLEGSPRWKPSEGNGSRPTEAPSGVELLTNLIGFVRRYVALSPYQALLIALWIVHTHALDAADTTAYLNIKSAEKRSGKTRLLETLSLLVARAWLTGRVTAAVLVRKVAAETPALLLDESDAAFQGDRGYAETLRGVLNAGFRRGGVASLCVGQGANLTYEDFPVFSPKAIAGIGRLPDTVADRSIPIELQRRRPSERVERFRLRKVGPEAEPLQSAAAAWVEEHLEALKEAEPELPEELDDRAQDIIEPLLAIADEVGGEWPERAREAAVALLTGEHREDSESLGVRFLRDIRDVFDVEGTDRLPTGRILDRLRDPDDAPWRALWGEPLDANRLARMLKPYDIRPEKMREGSDTFRGYRRASFEDAWERYLPATPENPEQAEHPADRAGSDVPGNSGVPGSENNPEHDNPHKHGDVPPVPGVPPNSGTGGGRRLSAEEDQEVRKLVREGMAPELARAEVLGESWEV
jgi:hypothetical protein